MIVDDTYKTACVLKEAGYVFSITQCGGEIADKPGSLVKILDLLGGKRHQPRIHLCLYLPPQGPRLYDPARGRQRSGH